IGGGMGFTQEFGSRVLTEVTFERRQKHFNNSEARPFASDQSGDENSLFVATRVQTTSDTLFTIGLGVAGNNAREEFRAYSQYTGATSFTYFFDPDLWNVSQPWAVTLSAVRLVTDYNAPEPAVDPNITREDREWRFGVLGVVPITDTLSVLTQAQ